MEATMKSLSDKAATLGDNLSETQIAQEQFSAAITNLKADIGEILIPALTDAMAVFSDIIIIVNDLISAIKEGDWDGAIQTIVDAFGGLGEKIETAVDNIDWEAVNEAFAAAGRKIGEVMWEQIRDTIEGRITTFGEKLVEKLPGGKAVETGFNILRGAGDILKGLGVDLGESLQATEKFQGPIRPDITDSLFQPRPAPIGGIDLTNMGDISDSLFQLRPAPIAGPIGGSELGNMGDITFNIRNFIGLDEEAARTLGDITAEHLISELDRRAVRR